MPKVSVLMTNYNGSRYIGSAIESILYQTFTDFECIIVDDNSTDDSWNIIQKYKEKDKRIRCFQNEKNLWISHTRNRLIDLAKGDYYAWLDSDDMAREDRLELQVDFLNKNPEYGIIGSWMTIIDGEGKENWIKKLPVTDDKIRKQWYFRNSLNHPTLMMRKEIVAKTGYYDYKMDGAEDYDYWIRAGTHCLLGNIPLELVKYRIHFENASIEKHAKTIKKTLLVRKKMMKMGYKIGILWYISYYITWCMQFVPPALVVFLFYSFIKVFSFRKEIAEK